MDNQSTIFITENSVEPSGAVSSNDASAPENTNDIGVMQIHGVGVSAAKESDQIEKIPEALVAKPDSVKFGRYSPSQI